MNGYDNEYQFVLAINNKRIKDLDPLCRDLIIKILHGVSDSIMLKAWRNHYKQKNDVMIKVGGILKGISIKMGSRNSIHVEKLEEFICFLRKLGISDDMIDVYKKYHYADGTIDGSGNKRLSSEEFKLLYQKDIDRLNLLLNTKENIATAVSRFVLYGHYSLHSIDALVYGTPNDFLFLLPDEITNIHLKNKDNYSTGVHFGNLFVQPLGRNLKRSSSGEYARSFVQIKWYSLFDDIIWHMNDRQQADYVGSNNYEKKELIK